jgi:hypothetical protein
VTEPGAVMCAVDAVDARTNEASMSADIRPQPPPHRAIEPIGECAPSGFLEILANVLGALSGQVERELAVGRPSRACSPAARRARWRRSSGSSRKGFFTANAGCRFVTT